MSRTHPRSRLAGRDHDHVVESLGASGDNALSGREFFDDGPGVGRGVVARNLEAVAGIVGHQLPVGCRQGVGTARVARGPRFLRFLRIGDARVQGAAFVHRAFLGIDGPGVKR